MARPHSAAAWAELLASADAAVVVTDAAGSVVRWGTVATALYGWSPDEAHGRGVGALLGHPDEHDAVADATARAAEGEIALVRRRVRTKEGSFVTVVGSAIRIADEDGEPRLVGLVVPAGDRDGPDGPLDAATAGRLRLVAEARAAQLAAEELGNSLRRLARVAATVAASPRLTDVTGDAAAAAREATGADAAGVWLIRKDAGVAEALALVGLDGEVGDAMRYLRLGDAMPVAQAIATGEPVVVDEPAERDRRFPGLGARGLTPGALAAVPLVAEDRVLGALAVYFDRPRCFRPEDTALLAGMAAVTASAVARSLALEASEAAAALLGTAMVSAPVGFAFFDRDLRFVRVNSRLVEINGLPADRHIGRTVEEVLPDLAAVVGPALRRVLATGEPVLGVEVSGPTAAAPGADRTFVDDFYPVVGDDGDVLGVGAVVRDVTEARAASARLALLAEATATLTASLDTREVLGRLADLLVHHVADLCTVLVPEEGMLRRIVVRHRDAGVDLSGLLALPTVPVEADSEAAVAYRTGRPVLSAGAGRWVDAVLDEEVAERVRDLGLRSVLAVPLATPRATFGVLSLGARDRVLGDEDVALAVDLATRAAVAFENATRYEREHTVAEALQRAVLPERLPELRGLALAGCYEPATESAAVGGDWYDAVPLPGGGVALVVGDIGGHGLKAAATMGQLRNAVHAWLLAGLPATESLVLAESLLGADAFATVGVVVLDPATGAMEVISAGHPPPVVVVDGVATPIVATNPPLGAGVGRLTSVTATLPLGGLLVLYTDGLVEVRGEDLTAGLARLSAAVVALGDEAPDTLCQKLLRDVRLAAADDACILLIRRTGPGGGPGLAAGTEPPPAV